MINLINADCMNHLPEFKDNFFDLAILDPPYGIGAGKMQMGKGKNKKWRSGKGWDSSAPLPEYFKEIFRVSRQQIIFGGNYFNLPITGGWIFWDKDRRKDISFSDGELAWTSFLNVIKKITLKYDGFLGADKLRIHPTQKPVKLYYCLLEMYAEKGFKIIDTHLGSGSSAIAAYHFGCDFHGYEIDSEYFAAMEKRYKKETAQLRLF